MESIVVGPVVVSDYADGRIRIEDRRTGELVEFSRDDPRAHRARLLATIARGESLDDDAARAAAFAAWRDSR